MQGHVDVDLKGSGYQLAKYLSLKVDHDGNIQVEIEDHSQPRLGSELRH